MGPLLIQLLRAAGVSRIVTVEPLAHRREAAAVWGADEVVTPTDDISGYGADVAFELAGNNDAVRIAFESVRPGGRVVLGGIPDSDTTTFQASLARRKGLTIAMVRRMNEVYRARSIGGARCSGAGPARIVAYSAHRRCASVRRCRDARRAEGDHCPLRSCFAWHEW